MSKGNITLYSASMSAFSKKKKNKWYTISLKIIIMFIATKTENSQIAWVFKASFLILQFFRWPILLECVCVRRRIYMHIIEPVLPHRIYSAARWNAILSARGYISLIHRTTITTHLIPECSLLKKKKKKRAKGRERGSTGERSNVWGRKNE